MRDEGKIPLSKVVGRVPTGQSRGGERRLTEDEKVSKRQQERERYMTS